MLKEYRNILVINLMHLGDLMLVTPVLRTLRANYPQARITLLADKKLRDLVEYNPHLDECLLLDKKGEDNHPLAFCKFIMRHFLAEEYTQAFDLFSKSAEGGYADSGVTFATSTEVTEMLNGVFGTPSGN